MSIRYGAYEITISLSSSASSDTEDSLTITVIDNAGRQMYGATFVDHDFRHFKCSSIEKMLKKFFNGAGTEETAIDAKFSKKAKSLQLDVIFTTEFAELQETVLLQEKAISSGTFELLDIKSQLHNIESTIFKLLKNMHLGIEISQGIFKGINSESLYLDSVAFNDSVMDATWFTDKLNTKSYILKNKFCTSHGCECTCYRTTNFNYYTGQIVVKFRTELLKYFTDLKYLVLSEAGCAEGFKALHIPENVECLATNFQDLKLLVGLHPTLKVLHLTRNGSLPVCDALASIRKANPKLQIYLAGFTPVKTSEPNIQNINAVFLN